VCYDVMVEGIEGDAQLVRFMKTRSAGLDSAAAIRCWIDEALLRTMARATLDGAILANPGTYESGLAAIALCLDDFESGRYPDSAEMIRALYDDQNTQESSWSIPKRYVTNLIHPNGFPDSSVDYGSLVLSFVECGEWRERLRRLHPREFDPARYPNLLLHPRLRLLIDFLTEVVCLQRYHPALGDGHGKELWSGSNLVPVQGPARIATLAYPQAIDR